MKKIKNYVYVDISITANSKHKTGIQRVVRELSSCFDKINSEFLEIRYLNTNEKKERSDDLYMNADNFIYLKNKFKNLINFFKRFAWNALPYRFASKLASYTTRYYRIKHLLNNALVDDNDAKHILLLLDSNWTRDALIMSKLFKSNGHKVVSIFYDLSPLIKPDFFEKGVANNFKNYWYAEFAYTDSILSISNTISKELKNYANKNGLKNNRNIHYDYFYLGCNFYDFKTINTNVIRDEKKYLSVGSIEPRKNVGLILNVFETLWREGHNHKITFIYNNEWREDSLIEKIESHPQKNKKLFIVKGSSDRELAIEYQSAYALISASVYEGYGLGLAEALISGCKVFASNIPVYKELYDDQAIFFENDLNDLKNKIIDDSKNKYDMKKFRQLSWEKAANNLLKKVVEN